MPDVATKPESAQIRETLAETATGLRELRTLEAGKRGDTWERDVRLAVASINALDAEHKAAQLLETPVMPVEVRGPQAAHTNQPEEFKTAGQRMVESAQYRDRRGATTEGVPVEGGLRTLLDSSAGIGGLFASRGTPLPPMIRQRRLFVRDLISVVPTGLNSVPYIRELNVVANELGATTVAEAAIKPEAVMEFVGKDAPIRKIAAWIPITSEIADDSTTLMGYINARLGYMLAIREEQQILSGSGVSPQLEGIRIATGVQTQAAQYQLPAGAGRPADIAATVALAIAKVENVDGDPDAIVMTPSDFWEGITVRWANRLDVSYSEPVISGDPRNLWGYPVVTTRAATTDEAIVGSFKLGATLFDRQAATIATTDSHSDYFIYNKLVVLAEERVGLGINRPDFFVLAALANSVA